MDLTICEDLFSPYHMVNVVKGDCWPKKHDCLGLLDCPFNGHCFAGRKVLNRFEAGKQRALVVEVLDEGVHNGAARATNAGNQQ